MSLANAEVDRFFQQSKLRMATYARVREAYDRASPYTAQRVQSFLDSLGEPMAAEMRRLMTFRKIANMSDGVCTKILAACSVDLKPTDQLLLPLGYAMQMGNAHALIADAIIDNKFDPDPRRVDWVPLAEMCLLEFFIEMTRLCDHDSECLDRIGRYYRTWFETTFWEESCHVDRLAAYDAGEVARISDKVAPIKIVFYPILKETGNLSHEAAIYEVIDGFARCFLLLDDYADWEEDLRQRRFTYPLTLALGQLNIHRSEDLPPLSDAFLAKVKKVMLMSEVLVEVYDQALVSLARAHKIAQQVLPTTALLLQERLESIREGVAAVLREQQRISLEQAS